MSQPLIYTERNIDKLSKEMPEIKRNVRIGISESERENKIKKLENYIQNLKNILEIQNNEINMPQDDSAFMTKITELPTKAHLYYFIGRLNPPHNGHLNALEELIVNAKKNGAIPLILLGNGPKKSNPLDNPISFELKKDFINYKLKQKGFKPEIDYMIREMGSPVSDISNYIKDILRKYDTNKLTEIDISHIAGGKDEDATKLDFIKPYAVKISSELAPLSQINIGTKIIEPTSLGTSNMSATQVRKDAYKNYLNNSGLNGFSKENNNLYSIFYQDYLEKIYNGINAPALLMNKYEVEEYIMPSLHKSKKTSTTKRRKIGGRKKIGSGRKIRSIKRSIKRNIKKTH